MCVVSFCSFGNNALQIPNSYSAPVELTWRPLTPDAPEACFSQLAAARGSTLVSPRLHVCLLRLAALAKTLGCTFAASEGDWKWQSEWVCAC